MKQLLPVLLGSDANVYAMARSFNMAYAVSSACICKRRLSASRNTSLIEECVEEALLEDDEVFVDTLLRFAAEHRDKTLLLISCADGYSILIARHQQQLKEHYLFASAALGTVLEVNMKESFYRCCDQHGLNYPASVCCTKENYRNLSLPFDFPCIIKASNSVAYWNCEFPGRKKVFMARSREELISICSAIYASSYADAVIVQDYIPGEDWNDISVNCYCGTDGKARLIAIGRPLLEEQTPGGIGNYLAILSTKEEALALQVKDFLEAIGWVGFCNLDAKYDQRTGTYSFFDMNPRQGRSSFYVTMGGCNLAQYLVEDIVEHKQSACTVAEGEGLLLAAPFFLLRSYVKNKALLSLAMQQRRKGNCAHLLFCKEDFNLRRLLWFIRQQINCCSCSARYFGRKWD